MHRLTIISPTEKTDAVVSMLQEAPHVDHVVCMRGVEVGSGSDMVSALVGREAADEVLAQLRTHLRWQHGEVSLVDVDLAVSGESEFSDTLEDEPEQDTLGWELILARARGEGRLTWWYMTFMALAGVIATVGLVADITAVIVGAMAISPDLSPVNAIAVALSARLFRRALRGLRTLLLGLGAAILVSLLATLLFEAIGIIESGVGSVSEPLTTFVTVIDGFSIVIAISAGIAAMVAFIVDQGRTVVGVAISVTTIPAAAYIGVALADLDFDQAMAALSVLTVNIIFLTLAQVITLALAKFWRRSKDRHPTTAG